MSKTATDKYPPQFVVDILRLTGYVISKVFWFVTYHGRENIPDNSSGSFLIAANHQTYIDPLWICLPLRRRLRFMAFDRAFEWRIIGPLISYLGAFPVSLEVGGTVKAMKEALRAVREGAVLTIFPEAAREYADGELLPFKTGAVRIALQTGVPILPVTVSGGNRIWPQKQKYPRLFRQVMITYHPIMNLVPDESLNLHENLNIWTDKLRETIDTARKYKLREFL